MSAPAVPRIGERSSWDRVLGALEDQGLVTRRRGDGHVDARCPAHDDGRASMTADYQPGDPGLTLLRCHAGCEFGAIVAALGLTEADTFDGPGQDRRNRIPRPRPAPRLSPSPARVKCARCRWAEIEVYRYTDRGEIVLEVVRKRCENCGAKNFPVRRPDGRGGWAWQWPDKRPLYRADAVREAVAGGRTVYVVEGEKDVHSAERAGEVATCNPGGAGKWRPPHSAMLAGAARVVIVADRDQAGYKHAAAVKAALAGGVGEVVVVEPAEGKDLADHLGAGRSLAELVNVDPAERLAELAARAEPGKVAELADRRGDAGGRKPPRDDEDQDDDDGEPEPPTGAELVDGSPGWAYMPPVGDYPGAVLQLTGPARRRGWSHVVSWAPDVRARLVTAADDGAATGRHFEIRVGDDTAIVSNADLRSGEWSDKFPDATGLGAKRVREVLHNIVTSRARSLDRTLAATRTGWHGSDGQRCYVWPDGRTFPDGRQIRLIGMRPELAEAARPRGESADAEIRQALADIVKHGRHGGMLGLGAGARSFGQSIRPVPAGLAPWGDPNSGKSSLGWHGRSLAITSRGGRMAGWPALPTRSFSATRTVIEMAANAEADLPTLFEDLALPADASPGDVRDANAKVEALIRSVANADEIRGRSNRELGFAPANYVRSIPLLTAERMPPVMMASLYRRAVVPRLYPGQIDTAWYSARSAELLTPLRTIGARVVRLLYDLGADAAERLDKYTAAALAELHRAIGDAAWFRDVPAMGGVVDASAAILGGLYLVAEVVPGVDPAALTAPAITYLTEALAEQADVIADRGAHAGSLADAVGQVLTRALGARRAHVSDKDGRPAPLVPGLAPSEQGLRDAGGYSGTAWEGFGYPLYWLPERGGIGIRSAALHALLAESRDPRAGGLTPRSLPAALLRDGASLPNATQNEGSATHKVRVGANADPAWLVLLRPELLTGDDESPRVVAISTGTTGTTGTPQVSDPVDDHSADDATENRNSAGQAQDEAPASAEPAEPAEPVTSAVPVVPVVPDGTGTSPGFVTASERFRAPALVADTGGAYLARPDHLEALELPSPMAHLGHAVGWAKTLKLGMTHAAAMPDDPVLVILPELAARLGLPASPPDPKSKAAREHPALEVLRGSGWTVRELRSWMAPYRPGAGGSTVRIWLPGWDDYGECPMWGDGVPAVTLAYRLGLFAERLGIGWRLTGGITGVDLSKTFRRKTLRLAAADPPKPAMAPLEVEFAWSRQPEPGEAASGWLHCYDGNGAYTSAYNTPVNCGGWRHAERPVFDPKLPGYWLVDPPAWDHRMLPDPFDPTGRDAATRRTGPSWRATPTLAVLAELGAEIRPLEAWLPDGARGRYWEPWYERVRDARAALLAMTDQDAAAVLDALRAVWHQTHGMITTQSQGKRRDHDHTFIAAYRGNLLRRLVRTGEAEDRWPLAIATDNVAFASADPDPRSACPAGFVLGDRLGQFKVSGSLPMADAVPLLAASKTADIGRLFEAARDYLEETRDGS